MSKGSTPFTERNTIDLKQGTYRAYSKDGTVLWEMSKFIVGQDKVPAGVSVAMSAMTVTGPGGKIVAKWNPEGIELP